jgi:ferredoxin
MRIAVDQVKCTGLGLCEAAAPGVFEIDEDGGLLVLVEEISQDQVIDVQAAIAACPTNALTLVGE